MDVFMRQHPELVEPIVKPDGTQYRGAFRFPPSKKACSELSTDKWMLCHPTGDHKISHPTCQLGMSIKEITDLYNLHMTCYNMRLLENQSTCFDTRDEGHIKAAEREHKESMDCLELLYMIGMNQETSQSFYQNDTKVSTTKSEPTTQVEQVKMIEKPNQNQKIVEPITFIEKPVAPEQKIQTQTYPPFVPYPIHINRSVSPVPSCSPSVSEISEDSYIEVVDPMEEPEKQEEQEIIQNPKKSKKKKKTFWSIIGFYFLVGLTIVLLVIFFLYIL
jgi:hypothetical protein